MKIALVQQRAGHDKRENVERGLEALERAAAAGADPAADAGESDEVETLVVTATHDPLSSASVPGGVEVVSGEELQRAGYDGVLEALRRRPGLHADQPGGRGSRGSVYTRGLDPNHTKVLVDGVALNDPTNARGGSFDFRQRPRVQALRLAPAPRRRGIPRQEALPPRPPRPPFPTTTESPSMPRPGRSCWPTRTCARSRPASCTTIFVRSTSPTKWTGPYMTY